MRKKVLIIGMLDSVHLANWVERIIDLELDIILFASRNYRAIHPKLTSLMNQNNSIATVDLIPSRRLTVYLEYLVEMKLSKIAKRFSKSERLRRLLIEFRFERIHALEIQHAGYLLTDSLPREKPFGNIIVTNWGSDIYYFSKFSEDAKRIQACLKIANFYSAECGRDYILAREFGFRGAELPIVPNSTTFNSDFFENQLPLSRNRDQIIMKCYGGTFGLGGLILQAAEKTLQDNEKLLIYAYSVTPELVGRAEEMRKRYPTRFKFSTVTSPRAHQEIIDEFKKSRLYVGASKSDGISTSFLEALATGAFPIQTSTSCASEWIESGAKGLIVEPSYAAIQFAIDKVLNDIQILEDAQRENFLIAKSRLSFETISEVTKSFYL